MRIRISDLLSTIARGGLVLAAFWLTGFVLVRLAYRLGDGWPASQVGILIACVFGMYLAIRLRVRFVAYLLAGQLAFGLAELCIHAIYGIRKVQGGPTHFAVMLAGLLGVLLGWYLSRPATPSAPLEGLATSPATSSTEPTSPRTLARHAA